jgi:DinB superfamily
MGADMGWNVELVDQLERHWQHQLRPRLDGLADEEYFWQPVPGCWTISRSASTGEYTMDSAESEHDPEPVTTIAWRLAHLIDVFGPPAVAHFAVPPAEPPAVSYSGTAKRALRQLDDGHDAWISDVRGLGATGLLEPQGALSPPEFADAPMARLVLYVNVEVIHHGAEICLLRDLYLRKGARDRI